MNTLFLTFGIIFVVIATLLIVSSAFRANFETDRLFTIMELIAVGMNNLCSWFFLLTICYTEKLSDTAYMSMFATSFSFLFFSYALTIASNGLRFRKECIKNNQLIDKIVKYSIFGVCGIGIIISFILSRFV